MKSPRYLYEVQRVDTRQRLVLESASIVAADRAHAIDRAIANYGWPKSSTRAQRSRKAGSLLPAVAK